MTNERGLARLTRAEKEVRFLLEKRREVQSPLDIDRTI
jgi:hypothetical protein